jgi:hypothetical protein
MVDDPDYANYIRCMEEIKRRQFAVDEILDGRKRETTPRPMCSITLSASTTVHRNTHLAM